METNEIEVTSLDVLQEAITETSRQIEGIFKSEVRSISVLSQHAPLLDWRDLITDLDSLSNYISEYEFEETEEFAKEIKKYAEALNHWAKKSVRFLYDTNYWNSTVTSFYVTLNKIHWLLDESRIGIPSKRLQKNSKTESNRIEALKLRLNGMENEVGNLDKSVKRILEADSAAQALPETLSSLKKANTDISTLHESSTEKEKVISEVFRESENHRAYIKETEEQIKEILKKCDSALATSMTTGLAGSFKERKTELQTIGWVWTVILVVSLSVAIGASYWRADQLYELMKGGLFSDPYVISVNLLISITLIGAPIWLAWLATKQVGYYFRLGEDYGFKAAVSASYEGFRREAERQDPELQKRILSSTIDRYDEAPLRFVDGRVSGSPIHELIQSAEFRDALKRVPDFGKEVIGMAKDKLKQSEETAETVKDIAKALESKE